MLRSDINRYIREAMGFFENMGFKLPPFAYWTPEEWSNKINNYDEQKKHASIIKGALGWDVTDFNKGNYDNFGLLLFTMRNGVLNTPRDYAEKAMMVGAEQLTPWHFHWVKTEDIINRGGGNLVVELYNASPKDNLQPGEEWKAGVFDEWTIDKEYVKAFHNGHFGIAHLKSLGNSGHGMSAAYHVRDPANQYGTIPLHASLRDVIDSKQTFSDRDIFLKAIGIKYDGK